MSISPLIIGGYHYKEREGGKEGCDVCLLGAMCIYVLVYGYGF